MSSRKDHPRVWVEKRPPRRGGAPAPVGQVLAEAQKVASQKAGSALTPDEWQKIVGPKIAARTRVGRLSRGSLTLYAASSAWCNELSFLTSEIVTRLHAAGWPVHALQIRVANFEALGTTPTSAPRIQAPLPLDLQERLALIDDPVLRNAVAEAAALSLAHAKQRKP